MKSHIMRGWYALPLAVTVLLLNGCYTDVGAVKADRSPSYSDDQGNATEYQPQEAPQYYSGDTTSYADTSAAVQPENEPYYDDDYTYGRRQFDFDYYYPPVYFGAYYYNPWYWPVYSSYFYDPFAYGFYYPYYTPGNYYPYRSGFYPYAYGNYHYRGGTRGYVGRRTFGDYGTGGRYVGRTVPPGTRVLPPAGRGQVTRRMPAATQAGPRGSSGRIVNRGNAYRPTGRVYARPYARPSAPRVSHPYGGYSRGAPRGGMSRPSSPPPASRGGSGAPSHGGGARGGGRR